MTATINPYSDRGVLLKSDVSLLPLRSAAMKRLIALTKRTIATDLTGNTMNQEAMGPELKKPAISEKTIQKMLRMRGKL